MCVRQVCYSTKWRKSTVLAWLTCRTNLYPSSSAMDRALSYPPGISTAHSFRYCLSTAEDTSAQTRARTLHSNIGRHLSSISNQLQPLKMIWMITMIQNSSKEIYELINKYRICKHKKCQFGFLAKRYILLLILRQCERVIERAHGEPPMRESWTEKGCLHVKLRTALTSISTWGMMLGSRGSRAGWIAHGRGGQRFSINSRRAVLHLEIEAFVENMKSERRHARFIPHYWFDFIISLYIHLFKSISHWINYP